MEAGKTQTVTCPDDFKTFADDYRRDELARQRLDTLLAVNAEAVREKFLYRSERERNETEMMKNPLSTVQTFSHLGLMLGIFTPAAIFTRFLADSGGLRNEDLWIFGVVAIVNVLSAVVGFFSGRLIGKMVREVEQYSWSAMLFTLPFIGVLWGIMAGGAGGVVILIIGAFLGAVLGAMVGGVALPIFGIFHRLLKKGDFIDRRHFLPLAFGITFIICGFILGL